MVTVAEKYIDLYKIMTSGQVFRMYETCPGVFEIFSSDRYLKAVDNRDGTISFMCSEEEYNSYWLRYFDLGRDYGSIAEAADPEDKFLTAARDYGCRIRILHQNVWEMMISFIISQQKQIPSIRKCVEALCERFGDRKLKSADSDEYYYAFPTAEQIAAGGADGLKGLSLGYRERYIYETSLQYLDHGINDEVLEAMDYSEAKKYLLSFTGIGEKVANCILLFGAGFVDAFPIDTHIKDILYREYYVKTAVSAKPQEALSQADYERITADCFDRYRPHRGIVQQWIFAYEIQQ